MLIVNYTKDSGFSNLYLFAPFLFDSRSSHFMLSANDVVLNTHFLVEKAS